MFDDLYNFAKNFSLRKTLTSNWIEDFVVLCPVRLLLYPRIPFHMHFLCQVNVISIIYCLRDANPIMEVDVFCSKVCKEGIKYNCISPTGERRHPNKAAQTSNSEESGHCSENATSNF